MESISITGQIAKSLIEVHFGGNWTCSNLKEHLADVTWQQATTPVLGLNTIAALTYHVHYYVHAALNVLQGEALQSNDKYSFDHPPIHNPEDWERLLNKTWKEATDVAALIEQLPDDKLSEAFTEGKYGNYYRNLQGIIEHAHYHLGQIVLVKKILLQMEVKNELS
jgi:hypothetical protein